MKSFLFPQSRLFSIAILFLFCLSLHAQVKVFENGNVGIKYTTSTPLSKLVLNTQGVSTFDAFFYSSNRSSSGGAFITQIETGTGSANTIVAFMGQAKLGQANYLMGVKGVASNATALTLGRSYGVYGQAGNALTGYNYGVYGYLTGSNNGAAIFGTSSGDVCISGKYAGYFYGNVYVTGSLWASTISSSDERIKKNISSLIASDSYSKISHLNPITYNLKEREFTSNDSTSVKQFYDQNSEYFKKTKYGFVAQELQKVYPDLVYTGEDGTLGIDYTGLIPILVSTIQEQQKKIDDLEKKINKISSRLNAKGILTEDNL